MRFTSVLPTGSLHAAASRRRFMQALAAGGALGADVAHRVEGLIAERVHAAARRQRVAFAV